MVISKMFCNGKPIYVVYPVSKVVPLPYFCGYMLCNSRIQTLIGSPDVLQTENTPKKNKPKNYYVGEGERRFDQYGKPHTDWKKNNTYVHKQRSG